MIRIVLFLNILFMGRGFAWTFEGIESEWILFFKKISLPEVQNSIGFNREGFQLSRDPVLCNLGKEYLLASVLRETPSHLLRSIRFKKIPSEAFRKIFALKKNDEKRAELEALTQSSWQEVLDLEKNSKLAPRKELIIQIATAQEAAPPRSNQPAPACMSLLLGASLLEEADFLYPFAGERTLNPRRASRVLIARWQFERDQIFLTLKGADGIFAQPLVTPIAPRVPIALQSQLLDKPLQVPQELSKLLRDETNSVTQKTKPETLKIYGAWAYVDKGRGYGLKMNDRLVVSSGAGPVEGHVVGYYGPEQKLTTKNGNTVQEGAIIFVRKGQMTVKLGDVWAYDSKRYPN